MKPKQKEKPKAGPTANKITEKNRESIKMDKKIKKVTDLKPDPKNFNKHSQFGMGLMEKSIRKFGFVEAGLISEDGVICSGNARQETAVNIGMQDIQIIDIDGTKPVYLRKKGLKSGTKEFAETALALNAVGKANLTFDEEMIEEELGEEIMSEWGISLPEPEGENGRMKLSDRFLVPPFSVLDTRQEYWQSRKRWWLNLGIKSELGRGGNHIQ